MLDALPTSRHPLKPRGLLAINARQLSSYGGSLETAVTDLEHYRNTGSAVLVLCGGEVRAKNLLRLLEERGIPAVLDLKGAAMPKPGELRITVGALSAGCEWPALKLAVLTEGQLTAPTQKKLKLKKDSNRQKLQSYTDLSPGDLVVHEHHGVGRFVGIQRMPVDGVEKDYIKIDYAGGDCLYVPVTQLDLVSKYIGGGEDAGADPAQQAGGHGVGQAEDQGPEGRQGSGKGLTSCTPSGSAAPALPSPRIPPGRRSLRRRSPTPRPDDQLRAIAEIKKDMEQPRPMDRLLCGDVGYGKTEVALRAMMKCVLDGKQAAILVPTTVLAQQHYATACGRFKDFPVKIEVLSRFTTAKEQKRILEAARTGGLDLLIGTHKLLQKSMEFKDLGLLVIDEEQRFGVTHKERLKEMSRQVDVLTLSATPIPRTLNMALSGLRDMSTIEEPPADRQPVQTYVLEHDWGILEDAMRRRNWPGAVRSTTSTTGWRPSTSPPPASRSCWGRRSGWWWATARWASRSCPPSCRLWWTARRTFWCAPPSLRRASTFPTSTPSSWRTPTGWAWPSSTRSGAGSAAVPAGLTPTSPTGRGKVLQETAAKRLAAIREYVEFGSGFKIAMRDLEIRGAGNLLGPEQSGYLMSVGYDLYLKLLEEAVLEERGEEKQVETECAADLTVNANIPDRYVASPEQRMDLYRRIAAIRTDEDASDLMDEMIDRYGEPPKPVLALLDVALLRAAAAKAGVSDITQKKDVLRFTLAVFRPEALVQVCGLAKYKFRLTLSAGETPMLTLKLKPGADVLETALELVEDLKLATQTLEKA